MILSKLNDLDKKIESVRLEMEKKIDLTRMDIIEIKLQLGIMKGENEMSKTVMLTLVANRMNEEAK